MGSHYIPVSGITIEQITQVITDAVDDAINDAVVDSGTPGVTIDPAIFCDYHGYVYDPPYTEPEEYPTLPIPTDQSIELIVTDEITKTIRVSVNNSRLTIYDSTNSPVYDANYTSNSTITLPTTGGTPTDKGNLFRVRFAPQVGLNISAFYNFYGGCIIAKFNVPFVGYFANAFRYADNVLEAVYFYGAHDAITRLDYAFYNKSKLKTLQLPTSLNAATQMDNMCYGTTSLKTLKMPSSLPEMTTWENIFRLSKNITSISIPAMPKLTTFYCSFYDAINLRNVTFASSNYPECTSLYNAFRATIVEKITIPAMDKCTTAYGMFWECQFLEEAIFPDEMPLMSLFFQVFYQCGNLRKVKIPNMPVLTDIGGIFGSSPLISTINTPTFGTGSVGATSFFNGTTSKIINFSWPTLRIIAFTISSGTGMIETIDIDWENSVISTTVTTPISIPNQKLSATEINRIFNALPSVTGRQIDVRGNPGYATCDKTIAQAKGYIVL